jgi:hypothetical protein
MHYYLQLGRTGNGYTGAVMGFQASPVAITNEDAGENAILEIPDNNPTLVGNRYLGTETPGVTVLGSDYLTQFEAPPAPGCYWDGEEWVCPVADAAE